MSLPKPAARRILRRFKGDDRTVEQITEHYELEKRLATRLRNSSRLERRTLYKEVYDELYASLPHHPRHSRVESPEKAQAHVDSQLRLVQRFLHADATFLEIGAGDGSLARTVALSTRYALALEVSARTAIPASAKASLVLYDGFDMPVRDGSVDLAFSNAVMEHLHPEDAYLQLCAVAKALKAGGRYVFYTPHRFMGPGDVSKYFDKEPTGFHLKEYTFRELRYLLKQAGFTAVAGLVWFRGSYRSVPLVLLIINELVLSLLPYNLRNRLAWNRFMQRLVQIRVAASK